jgi:integrase/recombinase XerD
MKRQTCAQEGNATDQDLLDRFSRHLSEVKGLSKRTIEKYRYFASRLLKFLGSSEIDPSRLTADNLRDFVKQDAALRKGFGPKGTTTSVRSFIRFLVLEGLIDDGLMLAIPNPKRWAQAALPQRLNSAEINCLYQACGDAAAMANRNRAIVMLLVRLGLRANEVAKLRLDDINWRESSLLVRAEKSHRERVLPLQQEVGDALVRYLKEGRPATSYREVFLRHTPFVSTLRTPSAVTKIVKRLLVKAGIERRSSGAHLLRHTLATQMVNRGATFKDVADVLGHQSLQTTAIYAKLDISRLEQVAMSWPGGKK